MKKLYPFMLILLCLTVSLAAQEDSITIEYHQETDTFRSATFANMGAYVFMQRVETRSLWKVPLVGRDARGYDQSFLSSGLPFPRSIVEYEHKLNDFLSINVGAGVSANVSLFSSIEYGAFQLEGLGLNVEPRWYLGMRQKIADGERANNLSGNYLGLQLSAYQYRFSGDDFFPQSTGSAALLNFGMQRRILRRSYFNFKAGLGASYHHQGAAPDKSWQPAFQAELAYGLAFGEGQPDEGRLCDALLCFREDRQLFKVNIANLLNGLGRDFYSGGLSLAFEQKLGAAPFSLQLDVSGGYTYRDNSFATFESSAFNLGFEPRYYYNLNKRIAQGKSANNLSANYFTLSVSYFNSQSTIESESRSERSKYRNESLILTPAWGFQRRIFEHGYIGYQLGVNFDTDVGSDDSGRVDIHFLHSDFEFGLAF